MWAPCARAAGKRKSEILPSTQRLHDANQETHNLTIAFHLSNRPFEISVSAERFYVLNTCVCVCVSGFMFWIMQMLWGTFEQASISIEFSRWAWNCSCQIMWNTRGCLLKSIFIIIRIQKYRPEKTHLQFISTLVFRLVLITRTAHIEHSLLYRCCYCNL